VFMPGKQSEQIGLFQVDEHGDAPFEKLSHENGVRFWYAREYMEALGYEKWSEFKNKALNRAMQACLQSNIAIEDNFTSCKRTVKGHQVDDYKLSRFACLVIALNGNPKNKAVAQAQTYFTSLAEWIHGAAFSFESADRIIARNEISDRERTLSSAASRRGVTSFGAFQNAGYRGMYNMDLWELKQIRGLEDDKRPLLDFMGRDELAGNLFRLSLTEGRLEKDNVRGQAQAEYVAEDVGKSVREMMIKETGKRPESLPVVEDIALVKRGLKQANKELPKGDDLELQRANRDAELTAIYESAPDGDFFPDCLECLNGSKTSHNGSPQCSNGSIAAGGLVAHCDCDYCSLA